MRNLKCLFFIFSSAILSALNMQKKFSLTGKKWVISANIPDSEISLSSFLMSKRELDKFNEKEGKFSDMPKAISRIQKAVNNGEKIGIFGDYDCDGITAAAQLVRYARRHNIDYTVRLPHRIKDGYGLSNEIILWFAEKEIDLLITVDTGISSTEEIKLAREKNIDVIITDHHQPQTQLPRAYAILHPQLEDNFPKPHPAGAGVAYALVNALEENNWEGKDEDLSLAMIGTIADLVPLNGANRKLVKEGLVSFNRLSNCPLATLREKTKSKTSTDIAFRIAPRINAAGRMDDPSLALAAILDGKEALVTLDELNGIRQDKTHELTTHAIESIVNPELELLLWAASKKYPHGIVGLIAGRLTENYGKPSCAVSMDRDICTASLRSPPCYNITEGLNRCSDLLIAYGGHAQAAGCTFYERNASALFIRLSKDIALNVPPEKLSPKLDIDTEIDLKDISLSLIDSLNILKPYGQGNSEPLFLIQNVKLKNTKCVGKEMTHLQFSIDGIKGIGFGLGHLENECNSNIDIVCKLDIDEWNGVRQPQVILVDIMNSK